MLFTCWSTTRSCPGRSGSLAAPACTDAELLAIAEVRHLLGRRSESAFLAEVARDRGHLFPVLPCQSEVNRRTRWLWGAFEQLRTTLAARLPEDDCQQVDTSALPVKHPSRVRGADQWTGPGNDLAARFGRDAAHAEWFYGFRLTVKTDLGSRIVRAWTIVPAAVSQRAVTPCALLNVIAEWRNRIETTFRQITGHKELARHGAHTHWGPLTRTAATIAAHTLLLACLTHKQPTNRTPITRLSAF